MRLPVLLEEIVADKLQLLIGVQESTVGAAFMTQTLAVNETTVKFEIWDTAGQERYHSLAPMYYRGAAAAIVVYDMTNPVSTSPDWTVRTAAMAAVSMSAT